MRDLETKPDETAPANARKIARWWMRGGIAASVLTVVVLFPSLPRGTGWAILVFITTLCALEAGIYVGWAKGYEDAGTAPTAPTFGVQPASRAGLPADRC